MTNNTYSQLQCLSQLKPAQASVEDFDDEIQFVSATQLCEDLEMRTVDKALLVVMLYAKAPDKAGSDVSFYNNKNGNKSSKTYDRMLVGLDVNGAPGKNLLIFLLGKGQNTNMFSKCLTLRDSGMDVGPGKAFVILDPSVIENRMGGKEGPPVVYVAESIIPVKLNKIILPVKPFNDAVKQQQGFLYHGVTAKLQNLHIIDTRCCGRFCDAIDQYQFAKLSNNCACYTADKHNSSVVLAMDLILTTKEGTKIPIRYYTSKNFTKFFFKSKRIPASLTAVQLYSSRRQKRVVLNSVDSILNHVNSDPGALAENALAGDSSLADKKGWTIIGWIRMGVVEDQATRSDDPRVREKTLTDNSAYTHHLCSIYPTHEDCFPSLEEKRIDANLFSSSDALAAAPAAANHGGLLV